MTDASILGLRREGHSPRAYKEHQKRMQTLLLQEALTAKPPGSGSSNRSASSVKRPVSVPDTWGTEKMKSTIPKVLISAPNISI